MGYEKEQALLARDKRRTPVAKRQKVRFSDFEFIDVTIGKKEVASFETWFADDLDVFQVLWSYIIEGYKCSITADPNGLGVMATLSMPFADHVNAGLILTGRAKHLNKALALVLFKSETLTIDRNWKAYRFDHPKFSLDYS